MVRYLPIIFILLSCGVLPKDEVKSTEYYLESPEFGEYIELFEVISPEENKQSITSLVVKFGKLEKPVVGTCQRYTNRSPVITIDREFWDKSSKITREDLMFHELGHCILNRGHYEEKVGGVPVSLMFPSLIPHYYLFYKEKYRTELFTKTNDGLNLTNTPWVCEGH